MAKDDDDKPDAKDDDHSLDMSQAAVKRMIAEARERGYITYDQLNTVLPPEQVSSEQIEDVMSMLSEMGINVIEDEEAEEAETGGAVVPASTSREIAGSCSSRASRTPIWKRRLGCASSSDSISSLLCGSNRRSCSPITSAGRMRARILWPARRWVSARCGSDRCNFSSSAMPSAARSSSSKATCGRLRRRRHRLRRSHLRRMD